MHQDPIHLVRLDVRVLEKQEGVTGVDFPWRAKSRLQHAEAATEDFSFSLAGDDHFARERNRPRGCGHRGIEKGTGLITAEIICAVIETRGEHRSVESNPASFLPKENLERGDVTVANKTFGLIDILWREVVKQICRAVSAAQGD